MGNPWRGVGEYGFDVTVFDARGTAQALKRTAQAASTLEMRQRRDAVYHGSRRQGRARRGSSKKDGRRAGARHDRALHESSSEGTQAIVTISPLAAVGYAMRR